MSTTVEQLLPGDRVPGPFGTATYITQTDHPIWPKLRLVVWRLWDGSWSHDALSPRQVVGRADHATPEQRMLALRDALLESAASRPNPGREEPALPWTLYSGGDDCGEVLRVTLWPSVETPRTGVLNILGNAAEMTAAEMQATANVLWTAASKIEQCALEGKDA